MNIKIPKTVKKYKPEVMKKLEELGFFDDTDTMRDKFHLIEKTVK